jgi:transketolase C-terminal domain/subunit
MMTEAIRSIDILEKDGLDVGILDMGTLKPLGEEAIARKEAFRKKFIK